jgi:hypothetical protein
MEEQYYKDDKTVHCEKCGGDYYEGDFPFCKGRVEDHGQMNGFDDAFEPYVDTQLLDRKDPRCDGVNERGVRGVTINSRSERREWMKKLGLQYGTQRFPKRGKKEHMFFDMAVR